MPLSARLSRIIRYPIKGFPGQELPGATLTPGQGLSHDREWALATGQKEVPEDGSWQACQAFLRLTIDKRLPVYQVQFDEKSPPVLLDAGKARLGAAETLESFDLPGDGTAGLVRRDSGNGYWDHPDAAISIINLDSTRALGADIGKEIDPLRFRGNLYVEGLAPGDEYRLIGRRLCIGDCELEVIRPIDRCKATSLDPNTGEENINMPLALVQRQGHVFQGVYARVIRGGNIHPGDMLSLAGEDPFDALAEPQPETAPPARDWPRAAEVISRADETGEVTSFWLRDSLAGQGDLAPGAYIRIHQRDDAGYYWRSYTVSGVQAEETALRISVKREGPSGRMSSHMHDHVTAGDDILISGPFSDMPDLTGTRDCPVLIFTAGIGATFACSMLRSLQGHAIPVRLFHSAREASSAALWTEMEQLLSRIDNGSGQLFLSRRADGAPGRLDASRALDLLADEFDLTGARAFLCGPQAYMAALEEALAAAGVAAANIHRDVFVSPSDSIAEPRAPRLPGPFKVTFSRSGRSALWTEGSGSLLELAESEGISLPANCRSGACQSCRSPVGDGDVAHLVDPVFAVAKGHVLPCCAVPESDVTLEV